MKKEEEKKKKKKRKNRTANPEKKSQSGQKLRSVLFTGSSCVFNNKNVIEL